MLSAMLLWGMMVEVLALGALGRGVLGWSWGATVALVLGAMLLGRALTMAVTGLVAWGDRSAAPALRAGQWLAMVLREYGAFVRGFVLVQPWVWLGMPADRLCASAQPMLLVHGYGCNRGIWWWLRPRLEAAGHVVATISLEPPWGGIDGFAEQLHARIEAVCAATGAPRVTLVAHSMGGLVSRAYLARHGDARVARLISIASPHGGSQLARLGLGTCARQMTPDSPWLTRLAAQRVTVPFVSVRTPQDNFVMPQDLQRHPDARDEPLPGVGHLAALCDARVLRLVLAHASLQKQ
ncbi:MAG: alpha/beta fold hydrolase [Ottowia sp.]|nr:MAG: alpha/beta fold hydrolase [Ottowia sp.]